MIEELSGGPVAPLSLCPTSPSQDEFLPGSESRRISVERLGVDTSKDAGQNLWFARGVIKRGCNPSGQRRGCNRPWTQRRPLDLQQDALFMNGRQEPASNQRVLSDGAQRQVPRMSLEVPNRLVSLLGHLKQELEQSNRAIDDVIGGYRPELFTLAEVLGRLDRGKTGKRPLGECCAKGNRPGAFTF